MCSRLLVSACLAYVVANQSLAIEATAVLRKIDVNGRAVVVFANGRERTVNIADDAKFLDQDGNDLVDGLASKTLTVGQTVTIRVEPTGNQPSIKSIRIGDQVVKPNRSDGHRQESVGKSTVGLKPLTEMSANDRYQDEDGGLYGGGNNELPDVLQAAATEKMSKITPRDAQGDPVPSGKIGLISLSMSNATQEFSRFQQLANVDPQKSSFVNVVDCAQGGQAMAQWADPAAPCWAEADRRLHVAGVSHEQVQVAWIKIANVGPTGRLHEHGEQLEKDTRMMISIATKRFPNLQIVYLGSRTYGGYSDGRLNPEPYAYEGAFVVRWLIQNQTSSDVKAESPLLLWGPYLWADGTTPRSDGLVWERADFVADGTHPSDSGRNKVAQQLLAFFKHDPLAKTWFIKP